MKVRCWRCGSMLDLSPGDTVPACSSCGHMYEQRDGIFDFLPPGSRSPVSDPFESSYGEFYDAAMTQRRWIVDLGRLVWDSDMNVMLDSMAAGVSSDPDETVLDVPVGGGTSLAWPWGLTSADSWSGRPQPAHAAAGLPTQERTPGPRASE